MFFAKKRRAHHHEQTSILIVLLFFGSRIPHFFRLEVVSFFVLSFPLGLHTRTARKGIMMLRPWLSFAAVASAKTINHLLPGTTTVHTVLLQRASDVWWLQTHCDCTAYYVYQVSAFFPKKAESTESSRDTQFYFSSRNGPVLLCVLLDPRQSIYYYYNYCVLTTSRLGTSARRPQRDIVV